MNLLVLITVTVFIFGSSVRGDLVNGVDVDQACSQNAAIARLYCRASADEPPAVKPKCDMYRKYCSDITPTAAPLTPQCQQLAYCNQYSGQNSLICKNAAFANGSSERQHFCSNYKSMCANVEDDPDDECGLKSNANTTAPPLRVAPNAFAGRMPSPGLQRLTDLNGGGPLATVGQSSIDNIRENMASSAANAPLFGILGKFAGMAKKSGTDAVGQAAGGDFSSIGSSLYSGSADGGGGPPNPVGPALGIQTIPGFDAAAQHGPFGTSPLTVGNNVAVGPFANAGRMTAVNPFGKVGWGNQWGAMGFSGYNGGGVDFGSVPGLTDLNNPLIGGKRRRRAAMRAQRINSFYNYMYRK